MVDHQARTETLDLRDAPVRLRRRPGRLTCVAFARSRIGLMQIGDSYGKLIEHQRIDPTL